MRPAFDFGPWAIIAAVLVLFLFGALAFPFVRVLNRLWVKAALAGLPTDAGVALIGDIPLSQTRAPEGQAAARRAEWLPGWFVRKRAAKLEVMESKGNREEEAVTLRCLLDGLLLPARLQGGKSPLVAYDGDESFVMEALEAVYYEVVAATVEEWLGLEQGRYRLLRRAADFHWAEAGRG
jgi:hypothetical protein